MTGLVFVDCSASSETFEVLNQVVDMGGCIVLANKKPLTSTMVTANSSFNVSYICARDREGLGPLGDKVFLDISSHILHFFHAVLHG